MPSLKSKKESDFLELFDLFIRDSQRGKRLQTNRKRITNGTIDNYLDLQKLLISFSAEKEFSLRFRSVSSLNKRELKSENNYWIKFYKKFSDYLYDDKKLFDNTVGNKMKILRTFFNYLTLKKGINTGTLHSHFYAPSEETQIVVVSPERLNYLINAKEFDNQLCERLMKVKDIFIFGCSVALRYSDLMQLRTANLEKVDGSIYLTVKSKKTQTFTKVKLPGYCIDIIAKYSKQQQTLLPYYHKVYLNKYVKELLEKVGWTETIERTKNRRGRAVKVYSNNSKRHYRFCDMVTTHTMRRTGITTLLTLGMNEQMVRRISGHAANSKEFYRYVSFSQSYLDKEIDKVHEKLAQKKTENVL